MSLLSVWMGEFGDEVSVQDAMMDNHRCQTHLNPPAATRMSLISTRGGI